MMGCNAIWWDGMWYHGMECGWPWRKDIVGVADFLGLYQQDMTWLIRSHKWPEVGLACWASNHMFGSFCGRWQELFASLLDTSKCLSRQFHEDQSRPFIIQSHPFAIQVCHFVVESCHCIVESCHFIVQSWLCRCVYLVISSQYIQHCIRSYPAYANSMLYFTSTNSSRRKISDTRIHTIYTPHARIHNVYTTHTHTHTRVYRHVWSFSVSVSVCVSVSLSIQSCCPYISIVYPGISSRQIVAASVAYLWHVAHFDVDLMWMQCRCKVMWCWCWCRYDKWWDLMLLWLRWCWYDADVKSMRCHHEC